MQQANLNSSKQSDYPDWHYQPLRLLKNELENPMEVVKEFFWGYTLPQARKHCREMLEDAMCNVEVYAINYLTICNDIEKLIEAAWLLLQKEKKKERETIKIDGHEPLSAMVQLLVISLRPERIFLLSPEESEAIDLFIIVPDTSGKPFPHYGTLIEAVSHHIPGLTFSLHTSSSFHRHIEEAHPFWLSVCTGEKQIYASPTSLFPRPVSGKKEALAEKMKKLFLTGMKRSCSFLEAAEAGRLHGDAGILLFLLHQSAELLFRALILSLTGTEVREHSLAILKKHLQRCAPAVCRLFPNDTDEEKALLSLLDSAYRRGRYDDSFSPDKEAVNILFRRLQGLHKTADDCFSGILRSLSKE